jgi:hypothetical protein
MDNKYFWKVTQNWITQTNSQTLRHHYKAWYKYAVLREINDQLGLLDSGRIAFGYSCSHATIYNFKDMGSLQKQIIE